MKNILKQCKKMTGVLVMALSLFIISCNKGYETIPGPIVNTTQTLGEKINTDPNYSILRDGLIRAGLFNTLSNQGNGLTIFAPDNTAFINSGLPAAVVAVVPLTTLVPLLQYHIVPTNLPAASLPSSYTAASGPYPANIPNVQMPTGIVLPGGNPLVRMNAFPARNGANAFVNNMPIVQPDAVVASNGVMHRIPFILQPPSLVLAQMIYPTYTYLAAAIARADSGQVGLNRLDSVMKFGVANITVFVPTNAAFQTLLTGAITQALILQGVPPATALAQATALASTPAVFSNPALFSVLTAQTVRGIVVYHLFGNRAFSVNLPLTTRQLPTLLNGAVPTHPGLTIDRNTATPRLLGLANGAGNFSNFTSVDNLAVNGVWHVIDRVLLPQ